MLAKLHEQQGNIERATHLHDAKEYAEKLRVAYDTRAKKGPHNKSYRKISRFTVSCFWGKYFIIMESNFVKAPTLSSNLAKWGVR
jgi:hypothetical protein